MLVDKLELALPLLLMLDKLLVLLTLLDKLMLVLEDPYMLHTPWLLSLLLDRLLLDMLKQGKL